MTPSVAVTGATGFYGRHIVSALRRRGCRLRVLERREGAFPAAPDVTPVKGSLSDGDSLVRLLDGVDAVVHCAGLVQGASRHAFHDVNVAGTARLVRAVRSLRKRPRFTMISSLAARAPELSPYAASKRAGEDIVRSMGHDLEWLILRPPVIYGPGDAATLRLFRLAASGIIPAPRLTSGLDFRVPMIYVSDAAEAVAEAVAATFPVHETVEFHDGCAGGHDWPTMMNVMSDVLGRKVRAVGLSFGAARALAGFGTALSLGRGKQPIFTVGKVREIFLADWTIDGNPLSRLTHWKPRVTLSAGFRETADWCRHI